MGYIQDWAKTGELFNFMRVKNLCPDIVTSSKSFGGGKASISAYVTTDRGFSKKHMVPPLRCKPTLIYRHGNFGEDLLPL